MKKALLASALAAVVFGAGANDDVQALDQINYTFSGDQTRLGVGITEDGEFIADFLKSFNTTYRSNWMAEAWYSDGAGGLKLDYHWVGDVESEDQLIDDSFGLKVNKLFIAADQNIWDDRKLTIGGGQEINDKFWNINLSKATTGARLSSVESVFFHDVLTGNIGGRDYIQNQTIETITRTYEHPYDWGAGARFGRYFDNDLIRLTGGLDFEKGDYSSTQVTGSLDFEKYFADTGHSLGVHVERSIRDGDFEVDKRNTSAYLMYRYDFGNTHQPTERFEEVKVVDEVALAKLREDYREVIQNEIDLESMAFFNFDSYELREDTQATLQELVGQIKSLDLASKINIVGHTCFMGPEEYNQTLSENRAKSAREFFIANGIDAEIIQSSGKGESEPAFDNEGEDFVKNRRVAISFLSLETTVNQREVPEAEVPVKWVKRPVKTPPSWLARALKNPAKHKRSVDVYRVQEQEQIETLGDIVFLNQAPSATEDSIIVDRNSSGVIIDVLSNDSDPDGDSLTVSDVQQPANGQVVNNGSSVTYTPNTGFIGSDSFEYTIDDGNGDQSTSLVTVQVVNVAPLAVADSVTTENTVAAVIQVLANDSDPDGESLTVSSVTQGANGTVTINGDGTVTYQANPGYVGEDSFTYVVVDADGAEATAEVSVTVLQGNEAPIALDDMYDVTMNGSLTFNPLANDSDPDGDAISVVSVDTSGLNGLLTVHSDGSMTYSAPMMFSGNDVFTYTITDSNGATSTATVTMCVAD